MSEDLINYWGQWIDGEEEIDFTIDGIIFKYFMVNKQSDDGVKDWVCFTSKEKLFSFIKCVLLPSIQISRTIGTKNSEVYLDVYNSEKTDKFLEILRAYDYEVAIDDYKRWISEIEKIEGEDFNYETVRNFIASINDEVENGEAIFLELQLFKNIKCVGEELIKEYEDHNMLDVLESKFELNKNEITGLFRSIDDNKFMIKRITSLLNERFV